MARISGKPGFHEWRAVYSSLASPLNHVFPPFWHPAHFTSLCGRQVHALNGEVNGGPYCSDCKTRLPEAEEEAAKKEKLTLEREEPQRQKLISQITVKLPQLSVSQLRYILKEVNLVDKP